MVSRPPIPALTGLRFVAAFAVLLGHAVPALLQYQGNWVPNWEKYILGVPGVGMTLFFVLSGFVIHYNYSGAIEAEGAKGLYNFFVARFARLYPLYICAIGFEFLFKGSYAQLPPTTGEALPYYLTLTQSWFYVPFEDAGLMQRFWLVSGVSWSISTEWFFYIVYPLVCVFVSRLATPRSVIAGIAVVGTIAVVQLTALALLADTIVMETARHFMAKNQAYGLIVIDANQGVLHWLFACSPYCRIFEFLTGCMTAALYMRLRSVPPTTAEQRIALPVMAAAILGTGFLVWFIFVGGINVSSRAWLVMISIAFAGFAFAPLVAVIIFCCARYRNPLVGLLALPSIVLCGEASYSLYLLHPLVIHAFRWTVGPVVTPAVRAGNTAMLGLTILSAIGLSLVTWHLIEVPARRWLRAALSSRQVAPAAEVGIAPAE